jgi:1-deoxy-D-xylulose-5-phosphate synthase
VDLTRTEFTFLPIGKWETIRSGEDVCILAVGTMVKPALAAAEELAADGLEAEVINCRYLKPMDEDLLAQLGQRFSRFVTVEESALWSGFGSNVGAHFAARSTYPEIRSLGLPDRVIEHAPRKLQLEQCGLTPASIRDAVLAVERAPAGS